MISIKSKKEIERLREGGKILAAVLRTVADAVRPGATTKELDELAEKLIRERGGAPIFKGYQSYGSRTAYPASICTSINDEVVHGIPSAKRKLRAGDIVGIDIGMRYPIDPSGMVTDMAVTLPVGKISDEAERLINVTRKSLDIGIKAVRAGATLGDIGSAIQEFVEKNNFGVVRDLVGHGVGHQLHEEPEVPNFGRAGTGMILKEGMVLALEPMVTSADWHVLVDKDGWAWRTRDGSLAAHFEHTVLVTKNGAEVLTRMK